MYHCGQLTPSLSRNARVCFFLPSLMYSPRVPLAVPLSRCVKAYFEDAFPSRTRAGRRHLQSFPSELLTCVADGQATCMLAAEETLGKTLFCSFVTVAQRVLCGLAPYPSGPPLQDVDSNWAPTQPGHPFENGVIL